MLLGRYREEKQWDRLRPVARFALLYLLYGGINDYQDQRQRNIGVIQLSERDGDLARGHPYGVKR